MDNLPYSSGFSIFEQLINWGFKVPSLKDRYIDRFDSIDGVMEFLNYWDDNRKSLPF